MYNWLCDIGLCGEGYIKIGLFINVCVVVGFICDSNNIIWVVFVIVNILLVWKS